MLNSFERAQNLGTRRAGLIAGHQRNAACADVSGSAAVLEFVQQVEFHIAALVLGFGQRLHVIGRFEMSGGLAHGLNRCTPGFRVSLRDQLIALSESHETEKALIGRGVRGRLRPAQDAQRRGIRATCAGRRSTGLRAAPRVDPD